MTHSFLFGVVEGGGGGGGVCVCVEGVGGGGGGGSQARPSLIQKGTHELS